jgi:hypothetical protein
MEPHPRDPSARRELICVGCGAAFDCRLGGDCWCAAAPVRLPMPAPGSDCLCPVCLRAAARAAISLDP